MYSLFNDAIQIQYKKDAENLDKKEAKNFLKNTCEGAIIVKLKNQNQKT